VRELAHQAGAVDVVLRRCRGEKLSRTTLTPAAIIRSSMAESLEAGPSVATILVAAMHGMNFTL
jgi:hypothetical protein